MPQTETIVCVGVREYAWRLRATVPPTPSPLARTAAKSASPRLASPPPGLPLSILLDESPATTLRPLFTLPYCKFHGPCIKLWSCPGIDPTQPPSPPTHHLDMRPARIYAMYISNQAIL